MKRPQQRLVSASALLLLYTLITPALAQEESPAPEATPPAESSDAAEAAADTDAESQEGKAESEDGESAEEKPSEPEVDPYAEAKERVARARALYDDGNYDAALIEFEQAYDAMLGHPARNFVLFNVGKCQEKLYRYDEAIQSYKSYLEMSGKDAEDRETVETKIDMLEGFLGTIVLNVSAKGDHPLGTYEVWVDGRLLGSGKKSFLIPGGNHEVEVRAKGFESDTQEVQVPARSEKEMTFVLHPLAKEYKGISPAYFWTTASLAVATGVTGGVFGIAAVNKKSSINQKPPAGVTEEDEKAVKSLAIKADIFFISAGVLATSATVLAFLTDWSKGTAHTTEDAPVKTEVGIQNISIAPGPGGGFLSVNGSF